jgi:tRNA pseudouridine38-40 synthase
VTLFDPAPPTPVVTGAAGAVRVRMTLAYNGSGFRGFALQPNVPTVAGALAQALHTVIGHPVELTCAGRTDAGVHAAGQVVHFDVVPERCRTAVRIEAPDGVDLDAIRRACNRLLAPAVVVRAADVAPPGFDARRSARWRRYRYLVLNREDPDPFLAPVAWHFDEPLDLRAMQLACDPIHGQHDFAAFCRQRPDGQGSTERRVFEAAWTAPFAPKRGTGTGHTLGTQVPELLAFEVRASAFCHQMVRSLVGTMVDMGRGRLHAGDMAWILRSGLRSEAGVLAPPHGLCLEEVGYADQPPEGPLPAPGPSPLSPSPSAPSPSAKDR